MDNIVFREFVPQDLVKMQKLFETCYGEVPLKEGGKYPSLRELEWKYLDCPFKSKIFLAEDRKSKEVIAIRPIVRKNIKIGNGISEAAHFMDVMTHPDYRRRGIFSNLMKIAMDYVSENITLCYTFPNRNSYPAYKQVTDWTRLSSFNTLLYFNFRGLEETVLKRKKDVSREGEIVVEEIEKFDTEIDNLLSKTSKNYQIFFVKDFRYLNWRYFQRPDIAYKVLVARIDGKLSGYIVFRVRKIYGLKIGLIVDWFASSDKDAIYRVLIERGANVLLGLGTKLILFLNFTNQPSQSLLTKIGFLTLSKFPIIRNFPFLIRLNKNNEYLRSLVYEPKNWFLSLSDNDAV